VNEAVPVTIRISYDILKELLKLPDDVRVLGIHGIDDHDGAFPLIIETPAKHIKRSNLSVVFRKEGDEVLFDSFA
jgi:hypothetical protein